LVESESVWNDCRTTELQFDPTDCWALRRGKPYGEQGQGTPVKCSHVTDGLSGHYLCVPLIANGETLGVLYLENSSLPPHPLSSAELDEQTNLNRRAIAVAERVSLALANLELRELLRNRSIQDPLTELYNRRHLEDMLNRELRRARRAQRPLSFVMIDIDHFKRFNDTFGHQAGDLLLREVAQVLRKRLRGEDLACRFGGDEFALILCETDTAGATACVNAIRESVRGLSLQYRGKSLGGVTLSAGIANFPAHGDNLDDLINAADTALYSAKQAGRDRVESYAGQDMVAKRAPASVSG